VGTRIWSSVRWLLVSVAAYRLACGEATRGNHVEFTSERGGLFFRLPSMLFFGGRLTSGLGCQSMHHQIKQTLQLFSAVILRPLSGNDSSHSVTRSVLDPCTRAQMGTAIAVA